MKKNAEQNKKFRRKGNSLAIGAVALISTASMSLTPITASAQTLNPLSAIGSTSSATKSLLPSSTTSSLTTTLSSISGSSSGSTSPLSTATGAVSGVTGTVSGVVNGVVGGVTSASGSATGGKTGGSLPAPDTSAVTNIIKDPVSAIQNGASSLPLPTPPASTSPSQDPTTVISQVTSGLSSGLQQVTGAVTGQSSGLGQVTGALKDPSSGLQQVTDALKDPAKGLQQVTDTIKNATQNLPIIGSGALPGTSTQSGNGGANVSIMKNESLAAKLDKVSDENYKLYLDYTGTRAVGLSLQGKTYVYFNMPEEFASTLTTGSFIHSIKASYKVPVVGLSGQGQYNSGSISPSNITIDTATNSIILEYNDTLSLALNDASHFSLEMDLNSLPASKDKVYTFYSTATDKNNLSLALLESKGAKAEITLSDNQGSTDQGNGGGTTPGNGGGNGNGGSNGSGSGGGTAVNSGGQNSSSSSFSNWLGDRLPKTASNIWNIGLAGLIVALIGGAIKFIKLRKLT